MRAMVARTRGVMKKLRTLLRVEDLVALIGGQDRRKGEVSKIVVKGCVPTVGIVNIGSKIQINQNPTSHVFCSHPLLILASLVPLSPYLPPLSLPSFPVLLFFPLLPFPPTPPSSPSPSPSFPLPLSLHHNFLNFLVQKDWVLIKKPQSGSSEMPQAWSLPINMKWGLIWNHSKIYCLVHIKSIQLLSTYFKIAGEVKHALARWFRGGKLSVCMNCNVAVNISRHRHGDAIGKTRTNS